MTYFIRFFLILMVFSNTLWAISSPSSWFSQKDDKTLTLQVNYFISSTCPHCHKADDFFREIELQHPWLHLARYVINEDKEALVLFNQQIKGSANFSVPAIFFCDSHWVGFATAQTTGKELLRALHYCKAQIEKDGKLSDTTVSVLKRWANVNQYDTSMIDKPSALYYLVGVALIDALSPCALFSLMTFLAMLFVQDSRHKQWLSGVLFIIGLGGVHYVQQAHAEIFFEWLAWFRIPVALSALVILYSAIRSIKTKIIPNQFVLFSFLLAFIVQAYQQTCLMNWSYLFEQWIHNQQFSSMQIAGYEFLYQLMYLLPLVSVLIVYTLVINRNRFAALKARLTRVGLIITAIVALLLIIYPFVLSYFLVSLVTLIGLILLVFLKKDFKWIGHS